MKLNIQIETSESCSFVIQDITCGDSGYMPESSESKEVNRFKYSETVSVLNLVVHKTEKDIQHYSEIKLHKLQEDKLKVDTTFDGWFTLDYVVIPTKEWVLNNPDQLSSYTYLYYSDGTNIYKYKADKGPEEVDEQVTIFELVEINPEGTTISKYSQDFMSVCFLKKCFINLCKQILYNKAFTKCKIKGSDSEQLIYNRDLLWMSINTISYLSEFGQLAEAERIVEILQENCNGICRQYGGQYSGTARNQCGCS